MKASGLLQSICWASLAMPIVAQVRLQSFPTLVSIGETYDLKWTAEGNYSYNIWLIRDESEYDDSEWDWTKVQGLTAGLVYQQTLTPSFSWTVPSNISTNDTYALWVNAGEIPFDGATVSTETEWFRVTAAELPSATPSASSTPTRGSGRPTEVGEDTEPSSHDNALSGGAIAGVVIGVVVAVIGLAGGWYLVRRRRNRSTANSEAEARGRRLAPVMQEGFPEGYELNKTMTKGGITSHAAV